MIAVPDRYISQDEYFLLEESCEIKHEYYQGAAYAMTGGSLAHNLIVANVISHLHPQLRSKSCQIFPSDLRLKVPATGLYTYPDIMVICGTPRTADRRNDTVINPSMLVEVLSPSTKNYDCGNKFQHYRTIETLREYLIIAQDNPRVDLYSRQEENLWLPREFTQINGIIHLASIECSLPLSAIYEKVAFENESESR